MLAILLIVLAIVFVVIVVIAVGIVWDVASHDHPEPSARLKWVRSWLPPFLSGEALRNWAFKATVTRVAKRVEEGRDATLPERLAQDIESGASRAMAPHVEAVEHEPQVPCPEEGQGVIGLTAPEVLAIADDLRRNLSRSKVRQIRDLAAENALKSASLSMDQVAELGLSCPLQGADRVCCTFPRRPLACRPLHAFTLGGSPPNSVDAKSSPDSFAKSVGEGVASGLTLGLQIHGLDAKRYELNSALVRALDTPDAADRWAKGDDVFADCVTLPRRMPSTTPTQKIVTQEDSSCFAI